MAEEIDADAIIWFVENGGTVKNETIIAMAKEIKGYRDLEDRLSKNGCGYRECGMAESGFSD
jgi:hypothetical protein